MSSATATVATILFTDIVRSTPLMQRLGDARARELFRAHHEVLRKVIASAGGRELQWLGDGVMAAFESAADAVGCAIAMQERVEGERGPDRLRIRVGLNAGEVLRDEATGGSGYFGTAVVAARRLCDRAEPGTILCGRGVADLLAARPEFRFRELQPLTLKGLAQPVRACEVIYDRSGSPVDRDEPAAEDEAPPPLPPLLADRGHFPFSGRRRELELLRAAWREAARGTRRVVLLSGEPGIGKTRLGAELARSAHAESATVLLGRCDEGLGVPFQPFVEALGSFLDQTPPGNVRERLGRHAGELVRMVPDLDTRVPGLPPPLVSDAATERHRLFDAVAAWLVATAAVRPLVLMLDDLHWADAPTLLLLRHVVRATVTARLLVVGTHRDTEVDQKHPLVTLLADLRPLMGVASLPLGGLEEADVVELLEQAGGQALDDTGRRLARAVRTETGGNPFFVGEVLRHLAEAGAIVRRDGIWSPERVLENMSLPAAVRDVVLRRVNRLSREASETLTLASVIGRDFDLPVLVELSTLDELPLLAALEEALAARLIDEVGADRYRFAHALVRSSLYEALTATRRVRLHQRVGEAIEARRPDDVTALAHQFLHAGPDRLPKAVEYTARAGDQALARLAHAQAAAYYDTALELQRRQSPPDLDLRCELLCRLGEAQRGAGEPEHRETLLEAAQLAIQLGDRSRLVRAALANHRGWGSETGGVDEERVAVLEAALAKVDAGDGAARARLLATLAAELQYAGERERRVMLSDEAFALARRVGDPATLAHVLSVRGHTIWAPETLGERLANSSEHLAAVARLSDPLARWYASATRPQVCMEAGDLAEVDEHLAILAQLTRELGSQPHLVFAETIDRAWRALLAGELEKAEALAAEAYDVGRHSGQSDALTYYAGQLLAIRYDQGRLDELVTVLEQAVSQSPRIPAFRATLALAYCEAGRLGDARPMLAAADFDELPVDLGWTTGMAFWAEVAARLEERPAAAALRERLAPFPDHLVFNGLFVFGAISRSLGLLTAVEGDLDQAESLLARAAATHERIAAPALLARTEVDQAFVLVRRGRRGDAARAQRLLDAAVATAGRLGLAGVARRAAQVMG
jgi:class 3 adenylate cyclase/tetratricopeptide (TPR) repeat protein